MKNKIILGYLIPVAALIMLVSGGGCARKIVNHDRAVNVVVSLNAKSLSPEAIDIIDHFELLVEASDIGSTIYGMTFDRGLVVAAVEVPSGLRRRFKASALSKDKTVLYEGETVTNISPGTSITLRIDMFPAAPMVNITPHYQYIQLDSSFSADIKMHNLPGISAVTLDFVRSDSPTDIVLVSKGSSLGTDVLFDAVPGDIYGSYTIYISNMNETTPIVDANGYAHLATVDFRSYADWQFDTATVIMSVQPIYMYHVDNIPILPDTINTDRAFVELYTDTLPVPLTTWEKFYGGAADDVAYCVCRAHDEGYIVTGETASSGAGMEDVYLAKVDLLGNIAWEKTYGGQLSDFGQCVTPTSDGGYIISGSTLSFASDGTPDLYLIKTNSFGDSLWSKVYGGHAAETGYSIKQTFRGDYIIAGTSSLLGGSQVYAARVGSRGDSIWAKTYSVAQYDRGKSAALSADGNFVIAGETLAIEGTSDIYLLKIDTLGNLIWPSFVGGDGDDGAEHISPAPGGGYVVIGYSNSTGAGLYDIYVAMVNSGGSLTQAKTFGFPGNDIGYSIAVTRDNSLIFVGSTQKVGTPTSDVYLLEISNMGAGVWDNYRLFGGNADEAGYSVIQAEDGGYVVAGYTGSFGGGGKDIYLIKTDAEGKVGPSLSSSLFANR